MKRSTLFTTVAALALSTGIAAAQSRDAQPSATDQQQTSPTPPPSGRTNRTSPSPSATSPSTQQQQNTQTQPAQQTQPTQRSTQGQQTQPSTTQRSTQDQQTQPAPAQRSTQGQRTQPSTSQTQQPAQSNQQQTQSPAATQQGAQQPSSQTAQPSGQQPSGQQPSGQAAVTTPEQRTRITSAIQQQNVAPVRVNFAVNTGVVVPRSVRLAPLPATIVSIAPRYRGYNYFVTEERIVIVEPRTKRIVEVLPMEGRAAAAPARRMEFTREQRESIKRHATSRRPAATTGSSRRVTVEETVPADVELEEFSDVVVREVPTVRPYRYIRRDNEVIVVDPGSRRVIEVID